MVPMVRIRIVFELHAAAFCINSAVPSTDDNSDFMYTLKNLVIRMKHVKVLDAVVSKFENELAKRNASFPFLQKSCRSFNIPANTRQHFIANLFPNMFLPRYAFIGFTTASGAAGAFDEDPFSFKPFDVQDITIYSQSRRYPNIPYQLDFSSDPPKFLDAWCNLFGNDTAFMNTPCEIQRDQFGKEFCLFAFWMGQVSD